MADDAGGRDTTQRPATPWWVKVIGLGLLVILIIAAIVLVVGGGRHGPGMHGAAGAPPLATTVAARLAG